MKVKKRFIGTLSIIFLFLFYNKTQACSMYKLTADGKTMVGCNEDAWRTTSKIWFENAKNLNEYGAGFTGSRQVGDYRIAPQSGMNEKGLTFSRLAAYHPQLDKPFLNRIKITNEVEYLTDILHNCSTVEEVKKYIEQYDHSLFDDDVFIYIDSTGKYLIVEPYKLIEGNDSYYVLSNFCPSITDKDNARNLERYRKGEDFLKANKLRSSLSFCRTLSDTMHVCRSRKGDGTLLTSIWDTKDGLVNLYFYHAYESTVQFNLKEELSKGDHLIDVPDMFPKNSEFEALKNYKTPFNTPTLRVSLVILGGFLSLFSFLFSISMVKSKSAGVSIKTVMPISIVNLVLTAYLYVLATNQNIYYFDAPYKHYSSDLISALSYTPFLALLTFLPFALITTKRFTTNKTKSWIKAILVSNNMIYLSLIAGFAYWGLYSI